MFSIVTPVLNGMPYLPHAVRSVAQASSQIEAQHIIMDGGSTDGTLEWLQDNQDYGYEIHSGRDKSQSEALIKGFERAHGKYLGWLNADDLLEPDALLKASEAFSTSEAWVAVSGAALVINGHDEIIGSPRHCPPANWVHSWATYKTSLSLRPFSTGCLPPCRRNQPSIKNFAMDVDLWLQLAKHGPIHVLKNEVLSRVRIHEGAKTVNNQDATAREDLLVRLRHGMPPLLRKMDCICRSELFLPLPSAFPKGRPQNRGFSKKKRLIAHHEPPYCTDTFDSKRPRRGPSFNGQHAQPRCARHPFVAVARKPSSPHLSGWAASRRPIGRAGPSFFKRPSDHRSLARAPGAVRTRMVVCLTPSPVRSLGGRAAPFLPSVTANVSPAKSSSCNVRKQRLRH